MQVCVRPGVRQEELVGLSSRESAVNVPSVGAMSTKPLIILYIKVRVQKNS